MTVGSIDECNLTPRLDKMTRAFANVPDDKLRYQQLLFLAQKAKPMPAELKTEETKVAIIYNAITIIVYMITYVLQCYFFICRCLVVYQWYMYMQDKKKTVPLSIKVIQILN